MTRIALIAHDEKKPTMIDLASEYETFLDSVELLATGTTGGRLIEETDLAIDRKLSGPDGGDAEIAAEAARGEVDAVVFLRDPRTAQPHEPDISALLRICDVHDVPLATTRSAAEYLLAGLDAEVDDSGTSG